MKKSLLLIGFIFVAFHYYSATIIVTNTNDSGPGSLRQATIDAGLADEIRFDPSLLSGGSTTLFLSSEIMVSKGLFINGLYNENDTLYLSGNNSNRIFNFEVTSTLFANVSLDSLVFANTTVGIGGGVVKIYTVNPPVGTTHYITNCVFKNNNCPIVGALYFTSGSFIVDAEVSNCQFENNVITGPNNSGGAAINVGIGNSGSTISPTINLTVDKCNFRNNSSSRFGGAIMVQTNSSSSSSNCYTNLSVKNSSFVENSAVVEGGAVYLKADENNGFSYNGVSTLNVESCTFSGNSADNNGAGAFLDASYNSIANIKNSTFVDNSTFLEGSAVYVKSLSQSSINISSSITLNNAGNFNHENVFKLDASTNDFRSEGYNFFDFQLAHVPDYTLLSGDADVFEVTAIELNLEALVVNSLGTYTRIPGIGSLAANSGNPQDISDAQNGPILGVRDAGAAESSICEAVVSNVSHAICQGSSYDFYGQTLTSAGNYTHTIVSPGFCDTLVNLTLTLTTPVQPSISITSNPGNTIMIGTPVTFSASYVNGGATPNFQWLINGSNVGSNATTFNSSSLSNGDQISCVLTSSASCVNPQSATSNVITFTVHQNNNEACDAISLDVNSTCITEYFANHIATVSTNVGAHTCASSTSKDIWFSFIAPTSGNVSVNTYAGTLLDAVLSVYLGDNCSSLFEVGCVDDDGTNQMPQGFVTGATPGTVYYIRVSSYGTSASGNFGICLIDEGDIQNINKETSEIFTIFPNPNSGVFDLIFTNQGDRIIEIWNLFGQKISSLETDQKLQNMHLNELSEGIYFVKVREGNNVNVKKIEIIK